MTSPSSTYEQPSLRERKKQATRAALAEAAVRLAAEHGAEHVTVEAISEAAGVSPRTFFNYFASRDEAFILTDPTMIDRVCRAVLDAPASRPPLEVVRDAIAAELADIEERQEIWRLRAQVVKRSPDLIARSVNAHMAREQELARAITERLRRTAEGGTPEAHDEDGDAPLDLYSRLLAAVASVAVRVSIQQWSATEGTASFAGIYRRVFTHLANGLRAPTRPEPPARPTPSTFPRPSQSE